MSSTPAEAEGIDFERAKNFWQTRATRALSRGSSTVNDGGPPTLAEAAAANTLDNRPSVVDTGAGDRPPATPIEQYPEELERQDAARQQATAASAATPPPPAPLVASASAKNVMNNMFKTFQETKFFANSDKDAESSSSSSTTTSTAASIVPSMPVQLPDMSSWKEKMKMSRPTPPKMTFSFEKLSSQLKTSLSNATSSAVDAEKANGVAARNNIQRPSQHNTRSTSKSGEPSSSAFGELVVCEILAAKELSAGDFFQGESDPYVIIKFQDWERRTAIVKNTNHPVYNERFVFWVPASQSIDEQNISITLMNKNLVISDEHLGEVHISLHIPVNEAFDEWYPLVKESGDQKGHVRVGVRRMVLASAELQASAQALATPSRSLNDEDMAAHGSVLPGLWYGFAEAAEPLEAKLSQTDVLATKLNDLSRRFMGIEIASTEVTPDGQRRDIF